MIIKDFENRTINSFDWTGVYCLIDFEKRTCTTNYGADQMEDVDLPNKD